MFAFFRDIVKVQSFSQNEKKVILRIKQEMEKVGYDRVNIDKMGNVLRYIGKGKRLIAMDAHIDTVIFGEMENWTFDPLEGYEDDQTIGGRGTSNQKGGMESMVYAAKVLKKLNLLDDITLVVVGSVQEEDCDGFYWEYIIKEYGLKPEFVLITELTDGCIHYG